MKTFTQKHIIVAILVTLLFSVLSATYTPLVNAQEPEPGLVSEAEPTPTVAPTATPDAEKPLINVNTAKLYELMSLPGIGEKIAQAIIEKRPYTTIDELLNVKGIGYKKLDKIRNLITVDEPHAEPEAEPEAEPTVTPEPQ